MSNNEIKVSLRFICILIMHFKLGIYINTKVSLNIIGYIFVDWKIHIL
jgi:hypothetical protein